MHFLGPKFSAKNMYIASNSQQNTINHLYQYVYSILVNGKQKLLQKNPKMASCTDSTPKLQDRQSKFCKNGKEKKYSGNILILHFLHFLQFTVLHL